MLIRLTHRVYGVHKSVAEAEIPGMLADYATPRAAGEPGDYDIDEQKLLGALPAGFLQSPPGTVLLGVDDRAQDKLTLFRDWGKYFSAYMLWLITDACLAEERQAAERAAAAGPSPLDLGVQACRTVMAELDDSPVWLERPAEDDLLARVFEKTTAGRRSLSGSWCVILLPTLDMISVRAHLRYGGIGMFDLAELDPGNEKFKNYIFVRYPSDPAAITGPGYAAELRAAANKALAALTVELVKANARYFLAGPGSEEWRQVSKNEFVSAERRCGFVNTLGQPSEPATGGFSGGDGTRGRVEYKTAGELT